VLPPSFWTPSEVPRIVARPSGMSFAAACRTAIRLVGKWPQMKKTTSRQREGQMVRAVGLEPTTHGLKVRIWAGIGVCPLAFIVPVAHALPVLAQRRSTLFAVRPSADVRPVRASRRLCRQNCRQSDGSDLGRLLHDSPLECGFRGASLAAYSNPSGLVGCCLSDCAATKCGQFQNCRTSKPSWRTGSTVKHSDVRLPFPPSNASGLLLVA